MKKATRRDAPMFVAVSAGSIALKPDVASSQACLDECVSDNPDAQTWTEEREKVMSLGFTEDEAECWELLIAA
jgi:hypothetical protein